MKIEIRKAVEGDSEIIALLARITFREAFGQFFDELTLQDFFNENFLVSEILTILRDENNVFWLAFADELPVGYAKLKRFAPNNLINAERPAELEKLYVLQDFIGKGIGEQLQSCLFDEAKNDKASHLWLTVRKDNKKAIRFYKKHRFVETAEIFYMVGGQQVECEVLVKKL